MKDEPIYYLVTINLRGQASESSFTTDRDIAVVERDRILKAHPKWSCNLKVWR